MTTILEENSEVLQQKISDLTERVENEPEQWYKLLIERLMGQELIIEKLLERVEAFEKFEQMNSAVIENGLLHRPSKLKNNYTVKATDNLLPDEGFHNVEIGANGKTFRWTKQNFYFDIPVNREEAKIFELYLQTAIKPELLESIKCYENGNEIVLEKTVDKKGTLFKGILDETTSDAITRLAFQVGAAYVPKELDPNINDTRELAVTFSQLIVS